MSDKHVIFDIGDIFCKVNKSKFREEVERLSGYGGTFLHGLEWRLDLGLSDIKGELSNHPILCCNVDELLKLWEESLEISWEMIAFKNDLLHRGCKVGLLSNIGKYHSKHLEERYPELYDGCDLHLSYRVGVRKPSKLYYQSFLMGHPEYKGCIYVDDLMDNLEAGEEAGFRSFHFSLSSLDGHEKRMMELTLRNLRWCIFR